MCKIYDQRQLIESIQEVRFELFKEVYDEYFGVKTKV